MTIAEKLQEVSFYAKEDKLLLYSEGMFWKAYQEAAYLFVKYVRNYQVNSINFNDRNVTVSLTYQELQALMRECVDYTMKNYSNEFDKLEGRKMVNAKEAAKLLGKNVSTIHRWKASGYLHAKSVGGRDYFYMDEIKELTTLRAS